MKKFENPSVEVMQFEVEDVITTSGENTCTTLLGDEEI